jgi:hypothetical protein
MSNRPATFRQAELTRAIKGAEKAGKTVIGTTIDPDGKMRLVYATAAANQPNGAGVEPPDTPDELRKLL